MRRFALVAVLSAAVAAVYVGLRHLLGRHGHGERPVESAGAGITMGNALAYDLVSRVLWAPMFNGIADDIATSVAAGGRVLEVGCGPGHLAVRLARAPGLEITATDLDPSMIERAIKNAARELPPNAQPEFITADVAHLPFDDASFDAVVSTFSMHHWGDRSAGLTEIGRVLKPGGQALVWDFASEMDMSGDSLELVGSAPWRWPGPFSLCQRFEFRAAR